MRYEGNIFRPINEARSYILQCTVGCSHNCCTFCSMYKDKLYRVRSMKEIKEDIRMAQAHYGDLQNIFLADGDAIAMETNQILEILQILYAAFPSLQTVASYAGPNSTLEKSIFELCSLRAAGLNRAYLGVESGDEQILQQVKKGVSAAEMLQAGQNLVNSGFNVFCIVQLGLGGKDRSREHALSIANIVNRIKPQNLNALTFTPVPGTPLFREVQEGRFQLLDPFESLEEMKIVLENISVDGLNFVSQHASNYLPLKGTLQKDRDEMIKTLDYILQTRDGKYLRNEQSRSL
ncbi:MAG: radical SAM protein [Syntrophomonadaceae bacterium]|nr:radical SAM protein [Syntrophomonadaceae bacterium]MDD3271002.1 radical SAM protein [Syntrophomonadaceae bacterium]MDD3897779.1 radical SAM protein [Syntrophomonadaceae bacterium]MDD4561797.1 radical SAM protein [Syntrophomonadaceae bacterium]